jgi:peptidoglycan/LPS O-acetylase OafA/YrhL
VAEALRQAAPPRQDPSRRGPLGFRPDIQGIRAVAVLLVIAHHVAPSFLTGGYIGVDVFFVVSGYLITALLLREADRDGTVSLTGFYARRARRILPAATLVTLVTVVGSLVTLSLLRTQTVLVDALWASGFAANVRLALTGTDYFAQGQPPSPLRHYWSLAVEEQFYLLWPLLLLACVVLVRRRGGGAAALRRTAGLLLLVVVVASLAWSAWATWASPTTAYYSAFTRAHELAIGAACALLPRTLRLPDRARQVLGAVGLAGIAVTAWVYTLQTPFPGVAALVPVLAAAALVVAGEGAGDRPTPVGRLLGSAPMVRIGDWSYSLYLWHWPLIVLVRSNLGPERFDSIAVRLLVLVAVFVLSWATYRWVETPFRTGRVWQRMRPALAIYPASVLVVVLAVVTSTQVMTYRLGGWTDEPAISSSDYDSSVVGRDRHTSLVRASVLAAQEGRPVPSDLVPGLLDLREQTAPLGDCDYRTGTTQLCPIGDPDAERSIVVLGDSHARALSPAVEEIGRQDGYRVYVLVYSGCMATSLTQIERSTGRPWTGCEEFKDWAMGVVADLAPDLVVVSTSAGRVRDPETGATVAGSPELQRYHELLREGWRELFEQLDAEAGDVAIVGGTPKLPRETGVCLSQGHPDLGECAFEPGPYAAREARTSFAAGRDAGVRVVDATPWFCADGLCPSVVGRFITMRDSEHMTPDYARWLAPALAEQLGLERIAAAG